MLLAPPVPVIFTNVLTYNLDNDVLPLVFTIPIALCFISCLKLTKHKLFCRSGEEAI